MRVMSSKLFKQSMLLAIVLMGLVTARAQSPQAAPGSSATKSESSQPPAVIDDKFVIGANDVLVINVWKEPEISRTLPVRTDGKISLPLVGDVEAAGHSPKQLQEEITKKLQTYMANPEVTVIVQEIKSQTFNVLGEVMRPGSFVIAKPTTILDAIALAGGFRDFAKKKGVYVIRRTADGKQEKFAFNYNEVVKGKGLEQNIDLRPNDTVVVP